MKSFLKRLRYNIEHPERSHSGLVRTLGKRVYRKVSGVRIPPSPHHMKLTVIGFKKDTLLKYPLHKTQPLMGLGKNDRGELNIELGVTQVKGASIKIVPGKDGFIALTKKLREKLEVKKGDRVNIALENNQIEIAQESDTIKQG